MAGRILILTISWRGSFIIIGGISMVWALAWGVYFRDDPNKHRGVTPEEIASLPPYGSKKASGVKVPWGRLIARMVPVTVVYFCYGWILWLFLSWIPSFFKGQYHLDLKKSALFASGVFISGVVGDTLGGLVSDKLYEKTHNPKFARCNMVALMMFLCGISLVPIIYTRNMNVVALALSAGFFFAEMTIGPMWAIPMDIAPKFSGTASGLMNTGSALAAIISPVVGGYLIQKDRQLDAALYCFHGRDPGWGGTVVHHASRTAAGGSRNPDGSNGGCGCTQVAVRVLTAPGEPRKR